MYTLKFQFLPFFRKKTGIAKIVKRNIENALIDIPQSFSLFVLSVIIFHFLCCFFLHFPSLPYLHHILIRFTETEKVSVHNISKPLNNLARQNMIDILVFAIVVWRGGGIWPQKMHSYNRILFCPFYSLLFKCTLIIGFYFIFPRC